MPGENY
jgi:hypothetical protein